MIPEIEWLLISGFFFSFCIVFLASIFGNTANILIYSDRSWAEQKQWGLRRPTLITRPL